MRFEDNNAVSIEVILISDDLANDLKLIENFRASSYTYVVTRIEQRDAVSETLERSLEAARGHRPVIVFLDFGAVKDQIEVLAAQVQDMQRVMAVECVVTRPPADSRARMRLRQLGAVLFDARPTAGAQANIDVSARLH